MYGAFDPKSILVAGIEFQPNKEDRSSVINYYSFLAYTGHWLIMKMDTTDPNGIIYTYAAGRSGWAAYWSQRATPGAITYVSFDLILTQL